MDPRRLAAGRLLRQPLLDPPPNGVDRRQAGDGVARRLPFDMAALVHRTFLAGSPCQSIQIDTANACRIPHPESALGSALLNRTRNLRRNRGVSKDPKLALFVSDTMKAQEGAQPL